jgi:GntR family carbon starvation induced transcriptional regulator
MSRKPALSVVSSSSGDVVGGLSRSSVLYNLLRQDLLHGAFAPGEKLAVQALGTRYAMGASSVREALSRLSSEGLVERIDQKGFRVAGLDWAELPILLQTRCQVEGLALRDSIHRRTSAWEDNLVLLVHRLSKEPRSLAADKYVLNPAWEQLHLQLHQALLANCASRWLRQFCASLTDEAYRFRQVAASQSFAKRDEAEHIAIFQASIDGRAEEAVALLEAHYRKTAALTQGAKDREVSPMA